MSKVYQASCGEAVHGTRRFKPRGRLRVYEHGAMSNPVERLSGGGWGARFFVGLKVGRQTKYKIEDVIAVVRRVRKAQGKVADATILAQKGIYEDRSGELVVEPSAQVIIIDLAEESKRVFVDDMKALGEELRRKLRQEAVILEIQQRGVVKDVYRITA
jgi:hypothetical protein